MIGLIVCSAVLAAGRAATSNRLRRWPAKGADSTHGPPQAQWSNKYYHRLFGEMTSRGRSAECVRAGSIGSVAYGQLAGGRSACRPFPDLAQPMLGFLYRCTRRELHCKRESHDACCEARDGECLTDEFHAHKMMTCLLAHVESTAGTTGSILTRRGSSPWARNSLARRAVLFLRQVLLSVLAVSGSRVLLREVSRLRLTQRSRP